MSKTYKKTVVKAKNVMVDDFVVIAGLMYRVTKAKRNAYGDVILKFRDADGVRRGQYLLIFPKNTRMKIWNQA